jgi:hypothetical protein
MMRRSLLALFASLLLLGGCGSGSFQPQNYHVGSDGLVLTFIPDMLPSEVYEGMTIPVLMQLANKGASDVNYSNIIFSLKGDDFYVFISQDQQLNVTDYSGASANARLGASERPINVNMLHGKSLGYPDGEFLDLQSTVFFKPIVGLRESPKTQLFASVCYPYETQLGDALCVDANAFNGNKQRQVCSAQTLSYTNQGAPVAIVEIENRPSPMRVPLQGGRGFADIVQPVFLLHVRNIGRGTVLMPWPKDAAERKAGCALNVASSLLNGVMVNATLSGLNLSCSPNPLILQDDEGYTRCVLPFSQEMALSAPNYLATFTATLRYLYRESISADISIIRTAGAVVPENFTIPERDASAGFINGLSRCEYCSDNRDDSRCSGFGSAAQNASFACICGASECARKVGKGLCVYGQTFCQGTNYCCASGN